MNVTGGEVIRFEVGNKSFNAQPTSFDLARLAPTLTAGNIGLRSKRPVHGGKRISCSSVTIVDRGLGAGFRARP